MLFASAELAVRYGELAVALHFRVGEGEVLHMISHCYLQRAETRTARHASSWKTYAGETGARSLLSLDPEELADLKTADVEAAHTAQAFMRRILTEKKRRTGR